MVRELRLVVGVQDQAEHLLEHFIGPSWDAERTLLFGRVLLLDIRPSDWRPVIPSGAQSLDDGIDFRQRHPIGGLRRGARRKRPMVTGDLAVGEQVQVTVVQQSIDPLQRQSAPAAVANDPQDRLGTPHLASLLGRVSEAPALLMHAKHELWLAFASCPFALWTAFPSAVAGRDPGDYYGGSVAIGLASRRRSRVCV